MADWRKRHRIPFGYRIVDGKAQIDPVESMQLKKYFDLYLDGSSMADAATEAGLQCSATTFRNLLKRKEYAGTDYYPAIITSEYQKKLVTEWVKRKGESPRQHKERILKGVRIYTDFRMVKKGTDSDDLVEQMNVLYQRIRPKFTKKAAVTNG